MRVPESRMIYRLKSLIFILGHVPGLTVSAGTCYKPKNEMTSNAQIGAVQLIVYLWNAGRMSICFSKTRELGKRKEPESNPSSHSCVFEL